MKPWCEKQIKAREDSNSTFTCTQHIAEGRVYECPYKSPSDAMKAKYKCAFGRRAAEEGESK